MILFTICGRFTGVRGGANRSAWSAAEGIGNSARKTAELDLYFNGTYVNGGYVGE